MKHHFSLLVFLFACSCFLSNARPSYTETCSLNEINVDSIEKGKLTQRAITLTNYYINIVSSLEQSPTIEFCERQKKEILNNLKICQYQGVPELAEILSVINAALDEVRLTEMDREVYMQVSALKRKNQSLQAVSNALSTPMSVFDPVSGGINMILTFARAGVDLAVAKREQEIEEKQEMWAYDKNNIQNIAGLTNSVFETTIETANFNDNINKREFEEGLLRPNKANEYNKILSIADSDDLVSSLETNTDFNRVFDYYYHLGMGYVEMGQYEKAKSHFTTFLKQYDNTIFVKETKIGMVALTRLLHEQIDLTKKEAEHLIDLMIGKGVNMGHLANNDMAYLVASLTYLNLAERFKDNSYRLKAYECIYTGLDKMYNNGLNDASLVVAVLGGLNEIKSTDISTHDKICRRILNNSKCLSSTDRVALIFSLGEKNMPISLKQMFALNENENKLFFSSNEGQFFNISMDSVYVYDVCVKKDSILEIGEYTRFLKGMSKKAIKEDFQSKCKEEFKHALTDERFKYFFTKINPDDAKSDYCLMPGFSKEQYLIGGKFVDKMMNEKVQLIIQEKTNFALTVTEDLKAILEYCTNNMSDFSKLECTTNANYIAYMSALDEYIKTKQRPLRNSGYEWIDWVPGIPDFYTKADREEDLERYNRIMNDNFYTQTNNIFFWGDNLVYKPSHDNLVKNSQYIQVVIGKCEPSQIILTYTKADLKLVSCQQGGNYYEF